jgi:DNA-binding transcriptional LysR family regulator
MTSDRLNAMRLFSAVADAGSFVSGAKRVGMSTTAASRRIAELEKALGVRLLQRTTRRLQLTDAGKDYLNGCDRILAQLTELEAGLLAADSAPRGRLRIAVQAVLPPLKQTLTQYRREHPQVDLEVIANKQPVDMLKEQFDLWIHIFGPIPADHVARPLMPMPLIVAASPDYLQGQGAPTHPRQLLKHQCLISNVTRESNPWRFERTGEEIAVRLHGHFVSNDVEILLHMARAGAGIVRLPTNFLAEDLRSGRLKPVLRGWTTFASLQASVVYPSARHVPVKVRAFLEMLTRNIKSSRARRDQAEAATPDS